MNHEAARLQESRDQQVAWRKWGPYLSERQWGTVREDYSDNGNAWDHFSHDQARSRAYRWGEDGLAGISDDKQRLCFALTLWNGQDPILKERLFGLTNSEGNHGEDVKEYYFYLDSTPTHSYLKYLYKYPQAAYPYENLVQTNRQRGRHEPEYELLDTGVFDDDRYFDVFVEYAKESPEDILIQITVHNRGPEPATLHLLPTLWFRNTWSWGENDPRPEPRKPELRKLEAGGALCGLEVNCDELGSRFLYCDQEPTLLFTENETNTERLSGAVNRTPFVKDAFHNYLVHGRQDVVNPAQVGTKSAALYHVTVPAAGKQIIRLRLSDVSPSALEMTYGGSGNPFGRHFTTVLNSRKREADEFYAETTPPSLDADAARVMRQALAGMLWGKQFYFYDVDKWLSARGADPFNPKRQPAPRNEQWHHMSNADVISMPDKWESPWYSAWDLAFQVPAFSFVDEDFGKRQLALMLRERYLHPNGQLPAYEWNFGDVNPPVHAWSAYATYTWEKMSRGTGDLKWLENCFHKLLLNFTWWVNRKDRHGKDIFEGGFLGLDNVGVLDRSATLPTGGHLEQADGTAWMGLFCQNMLQIALELCQHDAAHEEMALKFLEHFQHIAVAMTHLGDDTGMWDDDDGFFYDVLRQPNGQSQRLKVRSMVGLLPLCSATVVPVEAFENLLELRERAVGFMQARPELRANIHDVRIPGHANRRLLSMLDETRLRRVLEKMLDENEFLSPFGLRSLSRYHAEHPYVFEAGGQEFRVGYLPGESDSGMFGGNSNWRGPIWMPFNTLIVRSLLNYYLYFGDEFTVECPTGSGRQMTLFQVAEEITRRLAGIFQRDEDGRRPVFGGSEKFQSDPHWRDCLQFFEYFHGDNGAGLGASHQTGWTGAVAALMHFFAAVTPEQLLVDGQWRQHREQAPVKKSRSRV